MNLNLKYQNKNFCVNPIGRHSYICYFWDTIVIECPANIVWQHLVTFRTHTCHACQMLRSYAAAPPASTWSWMKSLVRRSCVCLSKLTSVVLCGLNNFLFRTWQIFLLVSWQIILFAGYMKIFEQLCLIKLADTHLVIFSNMLHNSVL